MSVTMLAEHFESKLNVVLERHTFFARIQGKTEIVGNFVAALRTLACTCDFGDIIDSLIRDQLVRSTNSKRVHEKLLTKNPDLREAIAIVEGMESTSNWIREMNDHEMCSSSVVKMTQAQGEVLKISIDNKASVSPKEKKKENKDSGARCYRCRSPYTMVGDKNWQVIFDDDCGPLVKPDINPVSYGGTKIDVLGYKVMRIQFQNKTTVADNFRLAVAPDRERSLRLERGAAVDVCSAAAPLCHVTPHDAVDVCSAAAPLCHVTLHALRGDAQGKFASRLPGYRIVRAQTQRVSCRLYRVYISVQQYAYQNIYIYVLLTARACAHRVKCIIWQLLSLFTRTYRKSLRSLFNFFFPANYLKQQ
ncbi:hypothetical protein NDU88_003239 [Pleurodeles waltl]|uniref:Uncharacterized protein n=1 Tax=Pleurodeles waltl TaxID=8319 RepID=A0AAV7WRW3_PLEWA|nr:hypothetical protein NDU88_003239 [Pleurodeles waltl]